MDTKNFENYIVLLAILLFPILVLPSFVNVFITPKMALVTFALGVALVIKSARSIMKNSISFSASPFDLPVLILAAVYITSSILQTPNKMEAYFLPGTATAVVSAVLLFFVINQMPKKAKGMIYYLLFISAALAAVAILLATTGVFKSLGLPAYIQAQNFTTLGGPLVALVFLVATLPLGLSLIVKTRQTAQKAFFGVALGLIVLSSAITLFNSLPGKPGGELPGFTVSWFVAVDSLKQSPLLGVGPGNYTTAFNRFRPISYNSTPLWASRFSTAQSFFLTAVTETGLAGVAAFLTMAYFLFKLTRERVKASKNLLTTQNASLLSLLILGVALLVFPATPALLFTFFIFLALANRTTEVNLGMFTGQSESAPFAARLPVIIAALPIIIVVVFYTVQATRVLSADITYKKALEYVVINDGRGAYDTLQQAINTNPYVDRYRITYAQINIALANSIAQKEEVTEDDRNTIAQLVQQAIREGKVAVALNPTRAGNWEMLASIYRAIMPLAQGADAFAVQTYAQAVALDPLNLNTRIALGGIYYAAEAYEDAIDVFKLAVAAKPNHANAHYNLAVAYRENGNLDRAISEMSTVLSLVSRDSDDYTVASQALADLQDKKQAEIGESENLTPPPSGELPGLEPPLDLPEEAEPPEPVATPSPSPEASPTSPAGGPTPTPLP